MPEDANSRPAHAGRTLDGREPSLVLLVDDDPVILRLLADTLSDEGHAIVTAPQGAAALQLLAGRRRAGEPAPDVILLDMRMPVMDGWTFAEAYRRTPGPHAPIVAITAAHDAAGAVQIDAHAVLAKPFDLDELVAVVARCVARDGARVRRDRPEASRTKVRPLYEPLRPRPGSLGSA